MASNDAKIALLCSIALFEFSLNHKNDLPWMADAARKISEALDVMIAFNQFEKEN